MTRSPRQAAEVLDELTRARVSTRRQLGEPWFPLVCFGLLGVISAPVVALRPDALVALWLVGGPAALGLVAHHYRRRARRRGVVGGGRRTWFLAGGTFAGCFLVGALGGAAAGAAGAVLAPMGSVLLGYVLIGVQQHRGAPALAVALGTVLAVVGLRRGLDAWAVELVFGAVMVGAGLLLHAGEERA